MDPRAKSLFQLNLAVLLWGGTAMFAKGIALPVVDIICGRSLIAAGVLLFFLLASHRRIRVKSGRHFAAMVCLGLLLCLHWLTYFEALRVSTAAVAILSLHTYPVFTALIEPFWFRERLRRTDILLALGVLAGVVFMTPEISLSNATTRGILLGILSGLFFMVRNLMTRRFVLEYPSSALMFWQTLVTGIVLLPMVVRHFGTPCPPASLGLLVLLGTLFTALPQTLFSASLRHLRAKTVGIIAMLLPFYGAILGYLIHHEQVSARTAAGGVIILTCVVYETIQHTRETTPSHPQETR